MLKVYQKMCIKKFKKCEKRPWRNVTFSKVARLHYWKYNTRSNVNSDLSIVTIFRSLVESIGVIKKLKEILLTEKDGIPMLLYFHALLKVIILDGCFFTFLHVFKWYQITRCIAETVLR